MSEINVDNNNYTQQDETPNSFKKGFAITSFVLGLLGLLCCFCGLGWILAPLSLIFGIISLATKRGGKGLAIAGVVLSAITLLLLICFRVFFGEVSDDIMKFALDGPQYVADYEATGDIPEEFQKYQDPKYDKYWPSFNVHNFDEFYAQLVKQYKDSYTSQGGTLPPPSTGSSSAELILLPAV
ncbi:MAG: DUF4190 domain-containing protein [Ruminococcus sp.]|nr:DUF4190 domain-containing protein [Ruminococcus sp.]